jgi:hypothetical protein
MTKYRIVSYVRAEDYNPVCFDSISDAESEIDHLEMMNSLQENYYTIEEYDDSMESSPIADDDVIEKIRNREFDANDPVNW